MNSEFTVAVHALVFLHHKKETLSSELLAENICTNPARVRRVMAKLGKSGLIETRSGRTDGGYFCQKGDQISLKEVADALESTFVETSWHSGDPQMICRVASGMAGYMDDLYGELNYLCKEKLKQIKISDVEQILFENNKKTK